MSLVKTIDELQLRYTNPSDINGIATGFPEFDRATGGLQASDLIIVAGRPSMGKTNFAMNIAEFVSLRSGKPVLVFTAETTKQQLLLRTIASIGRIELDNLHSGRLSEEEWPKVAHTVALLKTAKLFIDDSSTLTPAYVRENALKLQLNHGLGLVIIDYVQLMLMTGEFFENRSNELAAISRSLKALAKELDVPVILLSQVNRSVESRVDKRPLLSDLRDSGSLEDDADAVFFIYRHELYDRDSIERGLAEVIVAKQRRGPTGTIKLKYTGKYTRFDTLTFP